MRFSLFLLIEFNSFANRLALKRLQSRRVDLHLRGEPEVLIEEWAARSIPTQMEQVRVDSLGFLGTLLILVFQIG